MSSLAQSANLLERLKDHNDSVRYSAAEALGNLGKASEQVIAALVERLKDENDSVRYGAADALGKLGKNSSDVATAVAERISQHPDSDNVGDYMTPQPPHSHLRLIKGGARTPFVASI